MKDKGNGRVVVITGASSGIGFATANYLLDKNFKVYGISKNEFTNERFQNFSSDVNDFAKVKEIFKQIAEKEGRIDVLINNAGYGLAGALENMDPQKIYDNVNTNLAAVITLSSLAIPYLKKTKGNIVNISSVGGVIPLPYQVIYSATKAGIEISSRALAGELKKDGVKVTAILPGDVNTEFTTNRIKFQSSDDQERGKREAHSIKKMEKFERAGKRPVVVSKVIYKVLTKKRPPLRTSVGGMYKILPFIIRFMPLKFINFLVRKVYC